MKKTTFATRKVLFLLICFSSLGYIKAQIPNYDVTEQERMITGFTSINVNDGIDVYLEPGVHAKVLVKTENHLLPKLKTELLGQELKISMEGSYHKPQKLEVHIQMPVLEGIAARGGSKIFTTGSFKLQDFYIRLSQGSDLSLDMVARKVSCNLSDGSDAQLRGKVEYLSVNARGSSVLKAEELKVQKCKLQALKGSDAYIRVFGELEMEAIEASGIYYHGTPTILRQKASNDSDIRAL